MSWQSKVLGLCKKYGSSAKFAVTTVLGTVVPGSPALVALVGQAFDTAKQSAQDEWEINVSKQLNATAADVARIEQVLTIVGENMMQSLDVASRLQSLPEMARQQLAASLATDGRTQETLRRLNEVAQQFDILTEQYRSLLTQQGYTTQAVNELLPLLRRLSGLAGVMDEIQKAVLSQQDSITSLQAYIQASNAIAAGRIDEATNLLKGLSATHPNLSGPHLSLAAALVVKKDLPDAQKAVFRFIQLRPQDKEIARLDLTMAMGNSEEVNLLVPGTWLSQKIGRPDAKWLEVTNLPGKIVLDPTENYMLKVAPSARDLQLAGLQEIATLDSLISVSFSDCSYLKGDGLIYLSTCQSLRSLDFSRCIQLANNLKHLSRTAGNVRSLILDGCGRLTDSDLAILRNMPHLETLNLTDCAQVTGVTFSGLVLPSLLSLNLSGCSSITDQALSWLPNSPNLQHLRVSGCRITDTGMAFVAQCHNLTSLHLDNCSAITNDGLATIGRARLARLKDVSLRNLVQITNSGLQLLFYSVPGVEYLSLNGCIRCLPSTVVSMRNLKSVDLCGTDTSYALALALKQKLQPGCIILNDHGVY